MTTPSPIEFCEGFLRREIAENTDKKSSPVRISLRLLARGLEMIPVYAELHRKLSPDERAIRVFLTLSCRCVLRKRCGRHT